MLLILASFFYCTKSARLLVHGLFQWFQRNKEMVYLTGAKEAILRASVRVCTRAKHWFRDCKLMATYLRRTLSGLPLRAYHFLRGIELLLWEVHSGSSSLRRCV